MSEREEGPLGDRKQQAIFQRADKKARKIIHEDMILLEGMPEFKRFMGRLIQRCGLTDELQTTNGGDLQRFMGRRSIAIEALKEFDDFAPGFYERVLATRRAFEQDLRRDLKAEENENE